MVAFPSRFTLRQSARQMRLKLEEQVHRDKRFTVISFQPPLQHPTLHSVHPQCQRSMTMTDHFDLSKLASNVGKSNITKLNRSRIMMPPEHASSNEFQGFRRHKHFEVRNHSHGMWLTVCFAPLYTWMGNKFYWRIKFCCLVYHFLDSMHIRFRCIKLIKSKSIEICLSSHLDPWSAYSFSVSPFLLLYPCENFIPIWWWNTYTCMWKRYVLTLGGPCKLLNHGRPIPLWRFKIISGMEGTNPMR